MPSFPSLKVMRFTDQKLSSLFYTALCVEQTFQVVGEVGGTPVDTDYFEIS